jgi:hypothetical protein
VGSGAFLLPVIAPSQLALLPDLSPWLFLWPPIAQQRLIMVATNGASATAPELALLLAVAAAAAAGGLWIGHSALKREFGGR